MRQNIRRLPDAELEVMQALWQCTPPAARADLEAILQKTHDDLAYAAHAPFGKAVSLH